MCWELTCHCCWLVLLQGLLGDQLCQRGQGVAAVEVEPQHEVVHLAGAALARVEQGAVPHQGHQHALHPALLAALLAALLQPPLALLLGLATLSACTQKWKHPAVVFKHSKCNLTIAGAMQ